jgi:RimK family alpha-L-glutamate ligase
LTVPFAGGCNCIVRRAVIAHRPTATNAGLAGSDPSWELLTPTQALRVLREGDVALGRLDVLTSLDGVEAGLWALGELEARGVHVLNPPSVLLACHDKLLTARLLARAGLPHPRTHFVSRDGDRVAGSTSALVIKPRFGSWGRDVTRCDDRARLRAHLDLIRGETWFQRQGAIVQELVAPRGYDLRLVVAGNRIVGAVKRVCAAGEWRTNVALGARRASTTAPGEAAALALAATREVGGALIGVDLLPCDDHWTILELNAAVEFTPDYALRHDIYALTASELARTARSSQGPCGLSTVVALQ